MRRIAFAAGFTAGFLAAVIVTTGEAREVEQDAAHRVGLANAREFSAVVRAGQAEERVRTLSLELDCLRRQEMRRRIINGVEFAEGQEVQPGDLIPPQKVPVPR